MEPTDFRSGTYVDMLEDEQVALVTKETYEVATVGSTTEWICMNKDDTMSILE